MLQNKANEMAKDLINKEGVEQPIAFDPAVILIIVQVIKAIIAALEGCNLNSAQMVESAKQPTLFQRFILRRIIRKELDDEEMHSYLGPKLFRTVLRVGSNTAAGDVEKVAAESK